MRRHPKGFSLIEILVVVAILLIIAAIAIPNYLSAIQRGYEAAAIGYLRHFQVGQEAYRLTHREYADTFPKLAPYLSASLAPAEPRRWPSGNFLYAYALVASPQGQGGTPPGQGGTPPGQGGTPPGQGGTPPGQGGTPPGQGGTPPGQGGTPPGQGGTPPGQGGTPPGGPPGPDSIVRSMYIFRLTRPQALQWQCVAEPIRDRTVNKFYFLDNSGVLRYAVGALPTAASPQL